MTFTLPDYDQIPNVGLYLEQVTKYLNEYLEPLGCTPLTGSMISNLKSSHNSIKKGRCFPAFCFRKIRKSEDCGICRRKTAYIR